MNDIPYPEPLLIDPRVTSAAAALVGAMLLAVLYAYRRRPYILYWIGVWVAVAAALGLRSFEAIAQSFDVVLPAASAILTFWSAALLLLAPASARRPPLPATLLATIAGGSVVALALAAVIVGPIAITAIGYLASMVALSWAAVRYLQLARDTRYAGAVVIGLGTLGVAASYVAAVAIALNIGLSGDAINQLLAVNVLMSVFMVLGMHLYVFEEMVGQLRVANEEVSRLAITDPLTGCHNRRFFEEIERRESQRHRRSETPLSVIFCDINHFKELNDTFGHDRGDAVLRDLATVLRQHVRESDVIMRWGGDEFVLLMACGEPEARGKAAVLQTAFAWNVKAAGLPEKVGLSVGTAAVPKEPGGLRDAIREADRRMYRDKMQGVT